MLWKLRLRIVCVQYALTIWHFTVLRLPGPKNSRGEDVFTLFHRALTTSWGIASAGIKHIETLQESPNYCGNDLTMLFRHWVLRGAGSKKFQQLEASLDLWED